MYRLQKTASRTGIIYWIFTVTYMGIIFYVSSLQRIDIPGIQEISDKLLHLCGYFILAFMVYLSFVKSGVKKYVFILAFLIAVLYGIIDEFHQALVPGRDATIGDVIADSLGALLGSYLAGIITHKNT